MGSRFLSLLLQRGKGRPQLSRRLIHTTASLPLLLPSSSSSSSSSRTPILRPNCNNSFFEPISRRFGKYGSVNLVLSEERKPRFELMEEEPAKKEKWRTKKRLKMQRKREKRKRKEANKSDPRRIRPKGRKIKQRFPTAEDRIKYKIEKAKMKEEMLVEKLKRYEVPKLQGPMPKPDNLTGEERFYMKKMAQKRSNYVPVGRRGVFGGVILNMHLHWKKHETVKVICKPCKPGQVHEYARDIARLSGGIPIQIIGDDTIIFYRGKNYVQPEVLSPIDTLSKRKALEKSKYEQSLETVRRFIAISEKELELYYRHVALYGDPASRYSDLLSKGHGKTTSQLETGTSDSKETGYNDDISAELSDADSDDCVLSGSEYYSNKDEEQEDEVNPDYELMGGEADSESEELSEVDSKEDS